MGGSIVELILKIMRRVIACGKVSQEQANVRTPEPVSNGDLAGPRPIRPIINQKFVQDHSNRGGNHGIAKVHSRTFSNCLGKFGEFRAGRTSSLGRRHAAILSGHGWGSNGEPRDGKSGFSHLEHGAVPKIVGLPGGGDLFYWTVLQQYQSIWPKPAPSKSSRPPDSLMSVTHVSAKLRRPVRERAKEFCEYCQIPESATSTARRNSPNHIPQIKHEQKATFSPGYGSLPTNRDRQYHRAEQREHTKVDHASGWHRNGMND